MRRPDFDLLSGEAQCQLPSRGGHSPNADEYFGKPLLLLNGDSGRSEFARSLFDRLLSVREDERKRLGQELHDCAGHLLVSLQFSIGRLRQIAESSGQGNLIDEIGDIIGQIDREIRSLAFMEQPVELRDRDVFSAVRALVFGFSRRTGIHTSFKCVGDSPHVDAPVSVALLRVAQEALVNIHRHSRATAARVRLHSSTEQIRLTISDNGVGMPLVDRAQGVGLQSMRYRVEMLGGRFHTANLKHGARICATVPLDAKHSEFAA